MFLKIVLNALELQVNYFYAFMNNNLGHKYHTSKLIRINIPDNYSNHILL